MHVWPCSISAPLHPELSQAGWDQTRTSNAFSWPSEWKVAFPVSTFHKIHRMIWFISILHHSEYPVVLITSKHYLLATPSSYNLKFYRYIDKDHSNPSLLQMVRKSCTDKMVNIPLFHPIIVPVFHRNPIWAGAGVPQSCWLISRKDKAVISRLKGKAPNHPKPRHFAIETYIIMYNVCIYIE